MQQTEIIRPDSPAYDDARRVWNGMIDRRPRAIVRCRTTADVAAAISMARSESLPLAVRSGGHNVAGFATCDDGIVIDLSPMNDVQVNAGAREAWIGGGALWGDIDRETQKHGMIVPGGLVSTTGVGGFTLGGGFSWTRNLYGATCDSLIGAEVVLADGTVVTTSETENPDLLWALRGAGGNFGVVTRFRFRTYPLGPDVYQFLTFFDGEGENMADVIRGFLAYCEQAPREVSPLLAAGIFPPGNQHFPEELHGRPMVLVGAVHAGTPSDGERALKSLREIGSVLVDFSGTRPYVEAQSILDDDFPAHVLRYYWKSAQFDALPSEAIDIIAEQAHRQVSPLSTLDVWYNAGAFAEVDDESAAFTGRSARFMVNPEANWENAADDEANIAWVRNTDARLRPFATESRYFNFPGMHEGGVDDVRKTFGPKYERLREVKRRYDPENVFRLNQNILP